jgi:hypothetical protein
MLHDMNRSWTPPEGYIFAGLHPDGGFLRVLYHQDVFQAGPIPGISPAIGRTVVTVILNDMGREVARTQHRVDFFPAQCKTPAPPVTGWTRFKNGFFMILIGLEEMIQCHKR